MVNIHHFQFDQKGIFNFKKMIYSFKNDKSFSEFKLFIIVRTFMRIRNRRTLEFVGGSSLDRKFSDFGIRSPEFGDTNYRILATVARILQLLSNSSYCRPNPANLVICTEFLPL
jgi:hypothetical protein